MLKISKDLFDLLYPIGTYYETSNANWTPSSAGWYGTWVEDSAGRILVALDTKQTEFNAINKTGGSKYMQNHYHDIRYARYYGDGVTISNTGDGESVLNITSWNWTKNVANSFSGSGSNIYTNDVGGGNSENLQPYKVVRRWHRTA